MTGRSARRAPGRLRFVLLIAAALIGTAGCQGAPARDPDTVPTAGGSGGPAAPQADLEAIRSTIDAVNATAGGSVADQQAQLSAHLDPARRAELQRCPTATTTVRFEPVERGLRAVPDPQPDPAPAPAPAPDGAATTYALPALIRIFSGDRLIGTDLTTLHLVVRAGDGAGEAYLTPFCVN
jgi:hypothetical protein